MERSNLSKALAVGLFVLKLSIVPFTLFGLAQLNPQPDRPTLESTPTQQNQVEQLNLGLCSLLGLIGLAGINRKKYEGSIRHNRQDEESYFG